MEILLKDNKLNYLEYIFHFLSYLILFSVFILLNQFEITLCLYKNITGDNCYGCGTTRALISIFQFQIEDAINLNWRILVIVPILAIASLKKFFR
tara:strand:+ start:851 stop:1135 length:285 start_codon:yes stop_codon:yes gene_type:complete